MDLTHVLDRDVGVLSGGELQRFAIGVVAVQKVVFRVFLRMLGICVESKNNVVFALTLLRHTRLRP